MPNWQHGLTQAARKDDCRERSPLKSEGLFDPNSGGQRNVMPEPGRAAEWDVGVGEGPFERNRKDQGPPEARTSEARDTPQVIAVTKAAATTCQT